MPIKLNTVVTDRITGFRGTAFSRTEFINKCVRIGIVPNLLKDGIPHDRVYIDELQLVENVVEENPIFSPWLGHTVTDKITGVTGIAVAVTTYIYAGPRVGIQPKGTVEGRPIEAYDADESQLEEYVEPKIKDRTGGPGDCAPMHRSAPRREP